MSFADDEKKSTSSAHVTLCHYLNPSLILIERSSLEKEQFLNKLISSLCTVSDLKEEEAVRKAVWDREKEGRTVLENGLAIPHARFAGIRDIKACLGILPSGYEDPHEKLLIKWVFLFLSPQDQFRSHLQMLARISRVFQDQTFLEALLRVSSTEKAFILLQEKEQHLG